MHSRLVLSGCSTWDHQEIAQQDLPAHEARLDGGSAGECLDCQCERPSHAEKEAHIAVMQHGSGRPQCRTAAPTRIGSRTCRSRNKPPCRTRAVKPQEVRTELMAGVNGLMRLRGVEPMLRRRAPRNGVASECSHNSELATVSPERTALRESADGRAFLSASAVASSFTRRSDESIGAPSAADAPAPAFTTSDGGSCAGSAALADGDAVMLPDAMAARVVPEPSAPRIDLHGAVRRLRSAHRVHRRRRIHAPTVHVANRCT
jgi:hypothetical protein